MPLDKSTGGRLYRLSNLVKNSKTLVDIIILTAGGMSRGEVEKMEEWHDRTVGKKRRKTVRFAS